jgi:AcrR family transcriptional regulator
VVRRPRDRKRQIADTAARLFCERGYHRVGVDDVAAEVGITGGAIYRHFGNKGDLLARTVADAVDGLEAALSAVDDHAEATEVLRAIAGLAVERRHLAVLLDREARHLEADERARHLRRTATAADRLETVVRRARPDLGAADVALLARMAVAVATSPAYHRAALPPGRAESLLVTMVMAALMTTALPRGDAGEGPAPVSPPRASRREALLAAATTLFARHGYSAVTMEEIGAAAGIAGTSIYQHFPGKADLLVAAFTRGAEWLQFGVSKALAAASEPGHALELVVRSYAEFVLGHTDLIGLLLTEFVHLPEGEIESLRRTQHAYVTEWVELLRQARPSLTEPEARFRTHGALAVVNDAARPGPALVDRPDVLADLALEVLAA